jgi:hypothetical protein
VSADAKLAKVLAAAQEYLDLAIEAPEDERDVYKRTVELHLEIARELERLSEQQLEESASRRTALITARRKNDASGRCRRSELGCAADQSVPGARPMHPARYGEPAIGQARNDATAPAVTWWAVNEIRYDSQSIGPAPTQNHRVRN